jgi:hypothetical protein
MEKESAEEMLTKAIALLEIKRAEELQVLKSQFQITHESFKPVSLLKSLLKEITESTSLKNGISSTSIGLATGYVAKSILFGKTKNPVKKLAGIALQSIVTNLASNNSDGIIHAVGSLLHTVTSKISAIKRKVPESEIEDLS